jgi:hypothetical protein
VRGWLSESRRKPQIESSPAAWFSRLRRSELLLDSLNIDLLVSNAASPNIDLLALVDQTQPHRCRRCTNGVLAPPQDHLDAAGSWPCVTTSRFEIPFGRHRTSTTRTTCRALLDVGHRREHRARLVGQCGDWECTSSRVVWCSRQLPCNAALRRLCHCLSRTGTSDISCHQS